MLRPETNITQLCIEPILPKYEAEILEVSMHIFSKRKLVDRELTLHEMLDDPIVQDVMRRDGVKRWQVEQLFENLRPAMRSAA
jgi:hypothetical protein